MHTMKIIHHLLALFLLLFSCVAEESLVPEELNVTSQDAKQAVGEAIEFLREQIEIVEPHIFKNGGKLGPTSPAYHYYSLFLGTEETRRIATVALISQRATQILASSHNLTIGQVSLKLPEIDTMSTVLAERCPTPIPVSSCPRSRYRTLDGTCNNPDRPSWGAANTHYLRLLPAWYADGVYIPRGALGVIGLPSPTTVSREVHSTTTIEHAHVSLLTAVWAQYLSHDLSRPIVSVGVRGERIRCCDIEEQHPECFAMHDDFCWEYIRSSPATTTYCSLGVREQLNAATAFLDGSAIYGTSRENSFNIRLMHRGMLKTQDDYLLPRAKSHTCKDEMMCFLGGDLRLNEHAGRAALQTLLVHEHNRIANSLAELNPQWSDETIFEEARAILVAEIQHITYNEFLPILLGKQTMQDNGLHPLSAGFFQDYDITLEPGMFNSVATSILEIILTLLPDKLPLGDVSHDLAVSLGSTALNVSLFYKKGTYEELVIGLLTGKSLRFDPSVSESLRRYLSGIDLAARTIQKGRDHGIPPYVVWRPLCGRKPANSFEDLSDVMSADKIAKLQILYNNVADIDLFTGVVSETPTLEALVGPTASCLLSLQFKLLKNTDRYWYENDLPPGGFTKKQLYEIRKVTMARLICDNVATLKKVPRSAFLASDHFLNNPEICDDIEFVDIRAWKSQGKRYIQEEILHVVVEKGRQVVEKRRQMEKRVFEKGYVAESKSPVGSAYANNKPNPTSLIMANVSVLLEATSNELVSLMNERRVRRQIQGNEFDNFEISLPSVDISGIVPPAPLIRSCTESEEHRRCDPDNPYRTISGHCNNLNHPAAGRSNTIFARMLPAAYSDQISIPRLHSVSGNFLPSPRTISTAIHNDISHPHPRYTLMVMQFGQFLDHDITFTPLNKGFEESILDCRDCESRNRVHPECWPIQVPDNDPYFPSVNISNGRPFCIAFTRSLPGQQTLGSREQINQNTAFLDASHIYGQDICEARELRTDNGYLSSTPANFDGKNLLPRETGHPECKASSGFCFKAGDSRSSEQPGLAVIHTIWMREHNRIADILSRINRHWDSEKVYQETRRIIIGQWQNIVYQEFLPRVLGWNAMVLYDLRINNSALYYRGYDEQCDPTILNEFATSAFRFGHSLIRNNLRRMDTNFNAMREGVKLRESFFNPDMLLQVQMIDELVRGLISTPMETLDNFLTDEITNHLFEDRAVPFSGLDLAALNIQRGRDHGIRSYNEYRKVCNLRRATSFEDLSREIKPALIERLRRIYETVDDIDLFTGGLCETPLQGGIIGPTFGCIIGLQFSFLKKCDRHWFETIDRNLRFTEEQLASIKGVSMAALICENCDVVENIQRSVFDSQDRDTNPRVPCNAINKVNLNLWRDTSTCVIAGQTVPVGRSRAQSPCTICHCTPNGPVCQSRQVDCLNLRSTHRLEDILDDRVCRAQCGHILDPLRPRRPPPRRPFSNHLQPPPPHQPRFSPQPRPPPRPSFQPPPPNRLRPNPPFNIFRPFPVPNFLRNIFPNLNP